MKCGKCQNENIAEAQFCSRCGSPLQPRADDTRSGSRPSYIAQFVANRPLASKQASEGERKQVTVLFADIAGSFEFLVDRDAETVQELLLTPVLERMTEAVHRFEGTVHRLMGDGIMALFGAPLAIEDHAVRACYAGLRMQDTIARYSEQVREALGRAVAIRVGINSG